MASGVSLSRELTYTYTYNEYYFGGILSEELQSDVGYVSAYLASEGTRKQPLNFTGSVLAIASLNGYMYIGGTFVTAGGSTVNRIMAWQGTGDGVPLGYGVDGAVRAMKVYEGALVVAGEFTRCVSHCRCMRACVWCCVHYLPV